MSAAKKGPIPERYRWGESVLDELVGRGPPAAHLGQSNRFDGETEVKKYTPVSYAIMVILATASATAAHAADAEEATANEDSIADVIVTAQRRSESIQNVPITIQAITGETIKQLNVQTFDDYVKFLPNVTGQGLGPGQNNIYMRGLSTGVTGIQGSGVVGSFPNVAIYLDDAVRPGAGPQSRHLCRRPRAHRGARGSAGHAVRRGRAGRRRALHHQQAETRYGRGQFQRRLRDHGARRGQQQLEAVINVPIIADKFAVRGVVVQRQAAAATSTTFRASSRASPTDLGVGYQYGACPPPPATSSNCPSLSNAEYRRAGHQSAIYKGVRVSALWQFNDDWNALITQSYQHIDADGVFAERRPTPTACAQPSLTVQLYNPSWNKDKFSNTAWTLNGRIGMLEGRLHGRLPDAQRRAGAGLHELRPWPVHELLPVRERLYLRGRQCRAASRRARPGTISERNTHQSHELRFSTPDDKRVRAIGGLFWERYKIQEQVDWHYKSAVDYFRQVAPPLGYLREGWLAAAGAGRSTSRAARGTTANSWPIRPTSATSRIRRRRINPNVRDPSIAFFDDITRGYTQKAAFASHRLRRDPGQADRDRRYPLLPHQQHRGRLGRSAASAASSSRAALSRRGNLHGRRWHHLARLQWRQPRFARLR